ncbi:MULTISPECIES: diaminobutyrate acetyltransferase [Thalassospira]|jgi:L-2,4-diaminobutyric acid acetyltransferase|uniref:L-2,4-diaminobutyric acid acetyltransferase n=1 Tax=Thalassospira xiamenensis TaxID=220697 RepID=A0ABR5Y3P2_9PROT|nr:MULTISPECIES: diaminobutyrate acetyltransferase [Thalassospira]MAL28675.1 diaminobutyrate acetyltransferase [Thalassospira sp.]MBR9779370.1 diaminobutyrate acetyltransferase [Rhodospirillales bacterium]KZD05143.1 L-2,4-diaminobutyric acid acetyltransferase [Thalassospira xiamenensis]KZD11839.1 L-2,4-diaminobutyric acid acetyltransferase [Thalassospira xiamenensis]MBL4841365.1 diaminobutyrate acetyltransferase [Thalassospira sp.]|tara:strand:- start:1793 stop:2341 length:549 start_codon:yes stop_codon:yes gene_type:complete
MKIATTNGNNDRKANLMIRKPKATDGAAVNELIAECKPLDENSVYCNLLQCSHFADTCVIAELNGAPVGFVSGYIVPENPERLFIWQVAVSPKARGLKLAKSMILEILDRPICHDVTELQTTITSSNAPSQGVFRSVARELEAEVKRKVLFERETHFDGASASEILWQIGPFEREDVARVAA